MVRNVSVPDYLLSICHTASFQRHVDVSHSGSAASHCATSAPSPTLHRFTAVVLPSILYSDGRNVSACIDQLVPFVHRYQDVYFSVYYAFRVVFINVVPCIVLVLYIYSTPPSFIRCALPRLGAST